MLDKEKDLTSVNVSTPDHMHAPMAMSAMRRGLHVYGQKPLTATPLSRSSAYRPSVSKVTAALLAP